MLAPKGFHQVVDKDAFVKAQVAVSKRVGVLRFTVPMLCLAAAAVFGGVALLAQGVGRIGYTMTAITLFCVAGMLLFCWCFWIPSDVKKRAEKEFVCFEQLVGAATVTMRSDEMCLQSDVLTRRVEYAKTRLCIETPRQFIILCDDGATVILETVCFEEQEETVAFLRDVFARWYVRVRG